MRPVTVVFGGYQGPIEPGPGEKVLFIGDCARWEGQIRGQPVRIDNEYVDRTARDPRRATSASIFAVMARMYWNLFRRRDERVIRLRGCPVSVAEHTLALAALGGARNPYLAPVTAIPFMRSYAVSVAVQLAKRLLGMAGRKLRAAA
jgi:hypothetical protein